MDEMTYDLPAAKRVFSRVGLSLTAILATMKVYSPLPCAVRMN